MNSRLILGVPWRATSLSSRIITAFVAVAIAVIVSLVAGGYRGLHWAQMGATLCCFAIAALWLLMMPNALWLARDARALRLPRLARYADLSLVAWMLLSVALPALALGAVTGHTPELLVLFTLIASGCMAYQLLPSNVTVALIVLGFAAVHMQAQALLPERRIVWIAPLAIVLTGAWIWRWMRLSRGASLHSGPWGIAILAIWRRNSTREFLDMFVPPCDAQLARSGGAWLRPIPELRRVDRAHPAQAICIALARGTMPLTLGSRLRQWSFTTLIILILALVVMGLNSFTRHDLFSLIFAPSGWFWLQTGGITAAVLPLQRMASVRRRWTTASAELPLLGLLPGLGAPDQQKRHLLRAIFLRPLVWLAVALLVSAGVIGVVHAPAMDFLYVLLVVAGSAGLLACHVLGDVGGKPLSALVGSTLTMTLLILPVTTMAFVQSNAPAANAITTPQILSILAWLIWLTTAAWLSRRGWRGLQQRPHPFLPN